MPVTPPSNLTYGTVVGKFFQTGLDTADAGREPDFAAGIGAVTFRPDVQYYKNLGVPATFVNTTVTATVDSNGELRDSQGNLGVYLIATDNPDLQPRDWTYTVTVVVSGATYNFPLHVLGGTTTDITFAAPAAPTPGTVVIVSHQDAIDAAASAAAALAAAQSVGGSIDDAIADYFAANPPSVTSVAGKNGAVTLTPADVQLGNVNNTTDLGKPISTAQAAVNAAKADLVGGLIPASQIPAIAITDTFPVASQAAMLALTAQKGDVAIRSDVSKSFILSSNSPSVLADWLEMASGGAILSVAGKTGVVTLTSADVGLANVTNTSDANKPVSTAQQTALNLKANLTDLTKANIGLSTLDDVRQARLSQTRPTIVATAANTWPSRASQIPSGYTGKVIWDHSDFGTVTILPSDMIVGDFVRDLVP